MNRNRNRSRLLAATAASFAIGASSHAAPIVVNYDSAQGEANYTGQGAYSDPGHNFWNELKENGTTGTATASDGVTSTLITFTEADDGNYGPTSGNALFSVYELANGDDVKTFSLNHVPADMMYSLYLYGINGSYANRGTKFTVNSVTQSTNNSNDSSFVQGNNYVLFMGTVPSNGVISGTFTANPSASGSPGNTEGDFNGLQIVLTPEPSSLGLVGLGALGLLARNRRRKGVELRPAAGGTPSPVT